ncbi:MAG: AMP-binding protein, partial [Flavobacteriaceae bacterium]
MTGSAHAPKARFDWNAHARRMREAGLWQGRTVDDLLNDAVRRFPDKRALVAYRADAGTEAPVRTITFGELGDMVDRAAGSMRKLGIGKCDVVGLMLPNWWEFAVASYAAGRIGAVVNPLMHIFRERELRFMLSFAETKAIVIPRTFRGFDFPAMLDALAPELPALEHIIVVDDEGPRGFRPLLLDSGEAPVRYGDADGLAPGDLTLLMYTSGTTGTPKGVMHPAETLLACCKALGDVFRLTPEDIHHGAMPFGHMNGYLAVMLQALYFGSTLTLQDVWDGHAACAITAAEKVTHMSGATPLLADMCRAVESGAPRPQIRTYLCGGAQIPPKVIEDAWRLLGTGVSSLWGMTETLSGTLTEPERAMEKSVTTDGRPLE